MRSQEHHISSLTVRRQRGRYVAEYTAAYPFDWASCLAAALAGLHINIHVLEAELLASTRDTWSVTLQTSADPEPVLMRPVSQLRGDAPVAALPELGAVSVEWSGDALEVLVTARDRVGLLGALLQRTAMLGLFPIRILARTDEGEASDVLYLSAFAGARPGDLTAIALRRMLQGHIGSR